MSLTPHKKKGPCGCFFFKVVREQRLQKRAKFPGLIYVACLKVRSEIRCNGLVTKNRCQILKRNLS